MIGPAGVSMNHPHLFKSQQTGQKPSKMPLVNTKQQSRRLGYSQSPMPTGFSLSYLVMILNRPGQHRRHCQWQPGLGLGPQLHSKLRVERTLLRQGPPGRLGKGREHPTGAGGLGHGSR
jgi:hypothetical protein